ncbi:hypothetical protein M514_01553 [Trichuris suis]|uniref:Uncharacterized protein n=1 Tax=Trichuris suis TaxID=68888 RepID=A0A085NAR1_9BILA|nr:hypothetical protein M513_01553 [Trichuris suis]KFD66557.1 hypothetical protein M514_01553 [Trichuris suis]
MDAGFNAQRRGEHEMFIRQTKRRLRPDESNGNFITQAALSLGPAEDGFHEDISDDRSLRKVSLLFNWLDETPSPSRDVWGGADGRTKLIGVVSSGLEGG